MKKIVLLMLLPFFLFAHSPSALEYLAGEHKWVNDTHKVQYQTIINKNEKASFNKSEIIELLEALL